MAVSVAMTKGNENESANDISHITKRVSCIDSDKVLIRSYSS